MSNKKLIYLDDAINTIRQHSHYDDFDRCVIDESIAMKALKDLQPAQPETSRIENALHGKSPEEQYDFLWWLLQSYAMNFTDSRQAAIEWLKGDRNERAD